MNKVLNLFKITIVGVILTIILMMLLAALMNRFDLGDGVINAGVIGIMILATFVNGIISGKVHRHKKWLHGLIVGVIYFSLWLIASIVLNKGIALDASALTTMMICLGSTTLGAMVS